MQFFSRNRPNAAPGSFPNGVITPDGRLHLGLPVSETTTDPRRVDPLSYGTAPSGGILVLMHPAACHESSPRMSLLLATAADATMACLILWDLRWRTVETSYLLMVSVMGITVAAFGLLGCYSRMPGMLGSFVILCAWQFFICTLPSMSLYQSCHCALQPLLIMFAVSLRRSHIPMWFSTGRSRQN